jgi:hypothetical protein
MRVRVEFKFREATPPNQRAHVVKNMAKLGGANIARLFPDEQDPELATMYKVDDVPDDLVERLVARLGEQPAVEYAERTPQRKLIR